MTFQSANSRAGQALAGSGGLYPRGTYVLRSYLATGFALSLDYRLRLETQLPSANAFHHLLSMLNLTYWFYA